MRTAVARRLFMEAVIRAQDSRHAYSWTDMEAQAAFVVASIPGISLARFCVELDIELDEERTESVPEVPEEMTEEEKIAANAGAVAQLQQAQRDGHPFRVEEAA
jgi:hypothetical protein